MRDPGELRTLAIKLYTGNFRRDAQCVLPEELDDYRRAWEAEASRRYDQDERAKRITHRS